MKYTALIYKKVYKYIDNIEAENEAEAEEKIKGMINEIYDWHDFGNPVKIESISELRSDEFDEWVKKQGD